MSAIDVAMDLARRPHEQVLGHQPYFENPLFDPALVKRRRKWLGGS